MPPEDKTKQRAFESPDGGSDDVNGVWHGLLKGEAHFECRSDEDRLLVARYRELASRRAWTLGHLGQSLDGFIATEAGESSYVSGVANLDHLHRLRALADAVVVGATTAAVDDPMLTTRRVPGGHAARVILDPRRRLPDTLRVFTDGEAPTLLLTRTPGPDRHGTADVVVLSGADETLEPKSIVAVLAQRSLNRVLVEGGGITVSRFISGGALDRLQVAVAPCLLGEGRRGVAISAATSLNAALRPPCRLDPMAPDVLYDFDLRGI